MNTTFLELRETLDEIPIFDTHEHFLDPAFLADGQNTLLRIFKNSYLAADCISAGMDASWWQQGSIIHGPIDLDRHLTISPLDVDQLMFYVDRVKNTAYARALFSGIRTLHNIDEELDPTTWETFSTIVQRNYEQGEWFDSALESLGIRHVIWDSYFTIENPVPWSKLISLDFHTDDFIDYPWAHPVEGKSAAQIAKTWGVDVKSLKDLLQAIDTGFMRYKDRGAIAAKIGVAYRRSLRFDDASEEDANQAFNKLQKNYNESDTIVLGNYTVRHIIQRSIETGMVVQIHTGYQCGYLDQGRPTHLVNLIQEFPRAKFVLFHGGYPYSDEAGLLAKTFPNVYLDLCWMPLLSPSMTCMMLERWIDLVPQNKIMWGGDVWSVEDCCGAVLLFKDTLAKVLGNLIKSVGLPKGEAFKIAERIMYQNAIELFEIDSKLNN